MCGANLTVVKILIFAGAVLTSTGMAQTQPDARDVDERTGTVVAAGYTTMVVRSETNQFDLFILDRETQKPRSIALGSVVRVRSRPGDEPGVRIAEVITVLETPPPPPKPEAGKPAAPAAVPGEPIPPSVRRLERDIGRQTKRFRVGVRAGTSLDSELFLIGAHAQLGPLFRSDVFLRPNIEFGFGEVTSMIALNLEAIYRLPVTQRESRYHTYIGAGPAFNFLHQNFEKNEGNTSIDFGNFEYKTGFNILVGLQSRRGLFFEVKTSIYSRPAPTLRLIVGYNF
jgi:hypothetical protein